MSERIKKVFSDKKKKLITFVTGGDPDKKTSQKILEKIVEGGSDVVEIGMPFSDPMADGPTIQLSSNRAINNGTNLETIFTICKNIRIKIPIQIIYFFKFFLLFLNLIKNIIEIGMIISNPSYLTNVSNPATANDK